MTLGVGWLRVDLSWDAIQHQSPSVSDWSAFDRGEMENNPTSVESILGSFGYPGKKIWITEYGAPAAGRPQPARQSPPEGSLT